MTEDLSHRDRLVTTAARIFWQKGYHAAGLTEVLAAARVPKGSLYHHFPEGKADLAHFAADWTADVLVGIIDDAFRGAPTWADGVTTFCHKMAKLFDLSHTPASCPISALMFDGPDTDAFRNHVRAVLDRIIAAAAAHGARLGVSDPDARAETLMMMLEGGWTLARARRQSDILRHLPARLTG